MPPFDLSSLVGLAGISLLTALVQGVKLTFPKLDQRWWPAVTLALAIALNVGIAAHVGSDLVVAAIQGTIVALAASGLYSHVTSLTGPGGPSGTPAPPPTVPPAPLTPPPPSDPSVTSLSGSVGPLTGRGPPSPPPSGT